MKIPCTSTLETIPLETMVLPSVPNCIHCSAKRFYLEPPNFCCSSGQVSIVIPPMPYSLQRLFSSDDEEADHFRKNVRTYNNNFAFTSFGAKYDRELTKNKNGIYTVCVQGQVYHFLDGILPNGNRPSGVQLYFYDPDAELPIG